MLALSDAVGVAFFIHSRCFIFIFRNPIPNNDPIEVKPVTGNAINYVDLTNDGPVAGTNPHAEYIEFWNDFLHKHKDILQTANGIPLWTNIERDVEQWIACMCVCDSWLFLWEVERGRRRREMHRYSRHIYVCVFINSYRIQIFGSCY